MAKAAHQHTHGDLARRYGVTRSAVQAWERRGLNRTWPLEQIDRWREMHTRGRVVMPPADRATAVAAVTPTAEPILAEAPAPDVEELPAKPTADQVIMAGLGFQETRTLKLRKEIERLGIIIAREKGELVAAKEVQESATKLVSVWCAELGALVNDLPGQIAGLSEAEIQPRLRARIELLKNNARTSIEALA